MKATVEAFYDQDTGTVSYVVYDAVNKKAAVIDPVLDYDPKSGHTATKAVQRVIDFIKDKGLGIVWILETHAHADHLSAAQYVKKSIGGKIAIGENIRQVQSVFKKIFNFDTYFLCDGSQFDYLIKEDEILQVGDVQIIALFVPGHTPADMAYFINDMVFVGDTLFMPDVGTARCDFPGGDSHKLYQSIQKILAFPDSTRLLMCHDYPPDEREPKWETTVSDQKKYNIHIKEGIDEQSFVAMRQKRDAGLEMPRLIFPSIQVNIRAGRMPPAENNDVSYLKIPINFK